MPDIIISMTHQSSHSLIKQLFFLSRTLGKQKNDNIR